MALQTVLTQANFAGNGTETTFDVDFSQKLLNLGILETPVDVVSLSPGAGATVSILRKAVVRFTFATPPPDTALGSSTTIVVGFRVQ